MDEINKAYQALNDLCLSIHRFQDECGLRATFRSPIIDHHHPDDHSQRGIAGLSKFLGHAETERDYVNGLLQSPNPPNEFSTNAPHLLAVWSEFTRAKWPIVLISQLLDCGPQGQVKVDVVADGGNQWIKINTMKYSRLMAEFREQDSYINSDYDSDSSHSNSGDSTGRTGGPPLTNSVIEQVQALLKAAKAYPRPTNLPPPTIRYVMNRLEEHPQQAYGDPRVEQTFRAIRQMGVELVLADTPAPTPARPFHPELRPTPKIMLDLSVIVALCCDTTHFPLPQHEDQIEARFRMRTASGDDLVEHSNTTKDLRDQLQWEVKHPLIEEIQQRLDGAGYRADEVEWFVTQEVKDRTPSILNIIGGPREKARASALYGTDADESFWLGSRYEGSEGILKNIVLKVIDEDRSVGSMKGNPGQLRQCMIDTCERMLVHTETHSGSAAPTPNSRPATPDPPVQPGRKVRKSRLPKRPGVVFPPNSRLPSPHTMRTMLAGLKNGMTVLTNNRGAVGKIVRELGVYDGFPSDLDNTPSEEHGEGEGDGTQGLVDALVWVVNPSSLAEWRRLEVEEANRALEETQEATQAAD